MEGTSTGPPPPALHPRFEPGEEVVFAFERAEFWSGSRTPRRKPAWAIGRILERRVDPGGITYTLSARIAARPLLCRIVEGDIQGVA